MFASLLKACFSHFDAIKRDLTGAFHINMQSASKNIDFPHLKYLLKHFRFLLIHRCRLEVKINKVFAFCFTEKINYNGLFLNVEQDFPIGKNHKSCKLNFHFLWLASHNLCGFLWLNWSD